MHAFGLEETGDYAQAEKQGRKAVELERRDTWGWHAVAHVYEMRNQPEEGLAWMGADTDAWALIGSPGGLDLVAEETPPPGPFRLGRPALAGNRLSLEFESPLPAARHALEETEDLRSWRPSPSAAFTPTTGRGMRVSVDAATGTARFYRVSVSP